LQVTHRLYENGDQNDFVDYDTQYFTDGFYGRPKGLRYPGGTSLAYEYNSNGHVIKEKDPTSSVVYRNITAKSSRNEIKAASVANHTGSYKYQVAANFFAATGQAESMSVSNGSTALQTLTYTYERFGNLETRHTTVGGGTTERFTYDALQRLTTSLRNFTSGSNTVNYTFSSIMDGFVRPLASYRASYCFVLSCLRRPFGVS
jgi:YD repeat-containing protein